MQKRPTHDNRDDSDAALVQGSAAGDLASFERLMQRHNHTLFRAARAILREGPARKIDLACEDAFSFAGERCDGIVARVVERLPRRSVPS